MLTFSQANGIHFITNNGALPSRENRLPGDEYYGGHMILEYCQKFSATDTVTVQCVSDTDTTFSVNAVQNDGTITPITPTLKESIEPSWADPSEYRYNFEFDIDFSSFPKPFKIFAKKGSYEWESAWQEAFDVQEEINKGNMLKFVYTNNEHPANFPNYQVNYNTGIVFFFYAECTDIETIDDIKEDSYENQSISQTTQFQYFEGIKIKTEPLPKFLVRKIKIAAGHFMFLVNDLAYRYKGSSTETSGASNFETLSVDLIQKEPLALSTDDRGLPTIEIGENKVNTQSFIGITSTVSFTQTAGWQLHTITALHNSASAAQTFKYKAGYTPGGDEIQPAIVPIDKSDDPQAIPPHKTASFDANSTVYIELVDSVGAIADFYVQFIKNTPS